MPSDSWGRCSLYSTLNRSKASCWAFRLARGGFAALERIGAELEAAFVRPASSPAEPVPAPPPPRELSGAERASLDIDLERQLLEDGIVVRGHDVARVVGLMTGRRVEWEE